jgi:CHAT domain-containing protein/Tfp pilus assembly protein PilF
MLIHSKWTSQCVYCIVITLSVASVALSQGVVVEEVSKGSEGERAGLRPGDLLTGWSRGEAQGRIDSPFDFEDIQAEQAPRGIVTLRGMRASEEQTWRLGQPMWDVSIHPELSPQLLEIYRRARDAAAGQEASGAHLSEALKQEPDATATWLLYRMASIYTEKRNIAAAIDAYNAALQRASNGPVRARLLAGTGSVFVRRNEWDQAERSFTEAIAASQENGSDTLHTALVLNDFGNKLWPRGDLDAAEEKFRRALGIAEKLAPESLIASASLGSLGIVAFHRGDLGNADKWFRQALPIAERHRPDARLVQGLMNNLGAVAFLRGDLNGAEEYHHRSLSLAEKRTADPVATINEIGNLGNVATARGDLSTADEYFRKRLTILEKHAPDSIEVAKTLNNLGAVALERGDVTRAEQYHVQSLRIKEKLAPGSHGVATSLHGLGEVALARGDFAVSDDYHKRELAILEKVAPDSLSVANSVHQLGMVAQRRGKLDKAEEYHRRALTIREKLAPDSAAQAEALSALANVLREMEKFDTAERLLSHALEIIESQIGRVGGDEDTRSTFRAKYASYYGDYIGLLLERNKPEEAFHTLERSRARSMLALLAERDLTFGSDLPLELHQRRQRNAAEYDRLQAQMAVLNPNKDAVRIEQSIARLRKLRSERGHIAEQIKKGSARLASLQYPEPLGVRETRRVLDPGTCLLSYSVHDDRTVLFAMNAQETLTVISIAVSKDALRGQVNAFRSLIQRRDARNRVLLKREARALYDLLIRPVEALIASSERVLLIPDGPLHALPFGALLRNDKQYLVQWKALHTAISVTVYAELKRSRRVAPARQFELVAFGDPQYPSPRGDFERRSDPEFRSAVKRGLSLAPLPYSRQEVSSIAALYPDRSRTFLGKDATEERAKSLGPSAAYVHFAAHGLLEERFPLNSALILTIPAKWAEGRENGLLQAWEVFEQVRWDADLVVLSACETGLGQELAGEGLVGLTRAFHYAGARSVIATLWKVEDRRTAVLMQHFYRNLRKGDNKDQALRSAQLQMLSSPASNHPVYWAGFNLSGEWK